MADVKKIATRVSYGETLVELGQARVHLIEPLRQGRVRFARLVDAAQYPSGDRAAARGDHGDQDRCPYGYRSGQVMAFFPFASCSAMASCRR